MLNDLVVGDAQVAFLNSASSAAMIKAGKLQAARGASPNSACRAIRTCRPWPRRVSRVSARCTGRACWRRRRRRSRCIDTLFKAIVEASKQPALKEAFDKQLVSIKVSESLDEAKTWLKGELDTWRKITSEVKIDLAE